MYPMVPNLLLKSVEGHVWRATEGCEAGAPNRSLVIYANLGQLSAAPPPHFKLQSLEILHYF